MSKNDNILKRLEIWFRKRLVKYLSSKGETKVIKQSEKVFELPDNAKVLLLRQDRIGDLLISTSFIRILKENFPNYTFDILLGKYNIGSRSIIESKADAILEYKKGIRGLLSVIQQIRKNKYDIVVDLLDNSSTTSSILLRFSKAMYKLGLGKENSYVYTHIVPRPEKRETHIVERLNELLKAFGIEPSLQDLSLDYKIDLDIKQRAADSLNIDSEYFSVAVNLAGSSISRYWGKDNFIQLITFMTSKYPIVKVYLFGTDEYIDDLKAITSKTNAVIAPKSINFDEYAAKLSVCNLIITPDTAAVHLASAFNLPCLALFDTSDEANNGLIWAPYGIESEIVTTDTGNLDDITPETCFEAFEKLYARIQNG